jgi:hypothetical protein
MKRMFLVLVFAATIFMAGEAMGQGPGGSKKKGGAPAVADDGVQKLEGELAKLRGQLQELEELVNRAKAAAAAEGKAKESKGKDDKEAGGIVEKKEGTRFGPGGFLEKKEGGGFGPGGFDKKGGKGFGGFGKKDGKGFGPGGNFGKKEGSPPTDDGNADKKDRNRPGPAAGGSAGPASIEKRLDRILRELEDIRREIQNR